MDNKKLADLLFPDVVNTPEYYEEKFPYRKLPSKAEVTRMAPSPTGFIHLGNLYSALADEIDRIRDFKQQILVEKAQTEGFKSRIAELQEFLDAADKELTEYDETMVRKYINQIMIYDDKFTVEFKAGVKLDIVR